MSAVLIAVGVSVGVLFAYCWFKKMMS